MAERVVEVSVTINGERHHRAVLARQLLVHLLRDTLALKGTHIGCDTGTCGACTVVCDGRAVKSCMMLAAQADGCEIETVEGMRGDRPGELHPLQRAFTEHHALQCGYCTPGMLMAARTLLAENPHPGEDEIRRALKGNVCRCTGYVNIVAAIAAAAGEADTSEAQA